MSEVELERSQITQFLRAKTRLEDTPTEVRQWLSRLAADIDKGQHREVLKEGK